MIEGAKRPALIIFINVLREMLSLFATSSKLNMAGLLLLFMRQYQKMPAGRMEERRQGMPTRPANRD